MTCCGCLYIQQNSHHLKQLSCATAFMYGLLNFPVCSIDHLASVTITISNNELEIMKKQAAMA
jgi:hypothetical protein